MTANLIDALSKNQWGFEGTAAVGTLTLGAQPTASDTITLGSITYTWVASGAVINQINRGADLAAAKVNVVAAINGSDGFNIANPAASAGSFSSNNLPITARNAGTAGNSVVFTASFASGSNTVNGSGVLGGTTSGAGGHGTAVAATSIIALEKLEWGDEFEKLYNPMFATGILARRRGAGSPVEHGAAFSFSDQPVVWEQLAHWLSMAFKGGVYPTYSGGIYTWTFTRTPTAHPNLDSITLERYLSNGEGGTVEQRATYCMLKKFGLKYAVNDPVKMSGEGFGRAFADNTATTSLSLPTPVLGVSALSKVYVDSTFGAIGGTLLSEQVIGWDFEHGTGVYPQFTAEGRSGLDFTLHKYNAQEVTASLKLLCLVDPTTYAAENTAAAAGTTRAIQIYLSATGSRLLKINGLFRHVKPFYTKLGEQNGQVVVEYELEEAPDTSNFLQAILQHPSVATKA